MSKTRCLLGFVIQRTDVEYFQTSIIDPIYKEAVKNHIILVWKYLLWL